MPPNQCKHVRKAKRYTVRDIQGIDSLPTLRVGQRCCIVSATFSPYEDRLPTGRCWRQPAIVTRCTTARYTVKAIPPELEELTFMELLEDEDFHNMYEWHFSRATMHRILPDGHNTMTESIWLDPDNPK